MACVALRFAKFPDGLAAVSHRSHAPGDRSAVRCADELHSLGFEPLTGGSDVINLERDRHRVAFDKRQPGDERPSVSHER